MDNSIRIYPTSSRGPFITKVISNEVGTLVYDGYFYYKDEDLPLQRVMNIFSEETVDEKGDTYRSLVNSSHIEIYERISGEDTSYIEGDEDSTVSGEDDDDYWERKICFFPTEITTLKYRVLKSNMNDLERKMVLEAISELEKEREKRRLDTMMSKISMSDD